MNTYGLDSLCICYHRVRSEVAVQVRQNVQGGVRRLSGGVPCRTESSAAEGARDSVDDAISAESVCNQRRLASLQSSQQLP